MVKQILSYIRKFHPSWLEWYMSLPDEQSSKLKKRMEEEGESFVAEGMWEYAEYAAFYGKYRKKFEEQEIKKYEQESQAVREAKLRDLKSEYGFDALKRLQLKKN